MEKSKLWHLFWQNKVAKVMHEYKSWTLHMWKSNKMVKDKAQALAIAMNYIGKSKKK